MYDDMEVVREKLNALTENEDSNLYDGEILQLSQELDKLIYENMIISESTMHMSFS